MKINKFLTFDKDRNLIARLFRQALTGKNKNNIVKVISVIPDWSVEERFIDAVPNQTLCFDDFIARFGLMTPLGVEEFCNVLESLGLKLIEKRCFADIALLDQREGVHPPCDWLQLRQVEFLKPAMKVPAAEFNPPDEFGQKKEKRAFQVSFPQNWVYGNSLSKDGHITTTDKISTNFKFLRHKNGFDVQLDLETGKEVFIGRASEFFGKDSQKDIGKLRFSGERLQKCKNVRQVSIAHFPEWHIGV